MASEAIIAEMKLSGEYLAKVYPIGKRMPESLPRAYSWFANVDLTRLT